MQLVGNNLEVFEAGMEYWNTLQMGQTASMRSHHLYTLCGPTKSWLECMHAFQPVLSQPVHRMATYRCDDTRGCIIKFWSPDDEHMYSKHVEVWNKLIVKQILCIKLLNYWDKCGLFIYLFIYPYMSLKKTYEICTETDLVLHLEVRETCKVVKQHMNIWTDSWVKRDQLDVTGFIISLYNAQHVLDINTSILRSFRLMCWVISWVTLIWFNMCWSYVVVWLWMDVLTSETCWALNREIIKQVTPSWSLFTQLSRWCTVQ